MNLPDGVKTSDIPGFRPEDAEYENAIAELTEELQEVVSHYRTEYPCLGDNAIKDVLLDLIPSRSGIFAEWQIEAAIMKLIEQELEWVEKQSTSSSKRPFETFKTAARDRIHGMLWLADRLLGYNSDSIESLIKEAWGKIDRMPYKAA